MEAIAEPEIIIVTIKLLNLHVPRAGPAPPPNIREGGLVHPAGRARVVVLGLQMRAVPQNGTHPPQAAR